MTPLTITQQQILFMNCLEVGIDLKLVAATPAQLLFIQTYRDALNAKD